MISMDIWKHNQRATSQIKNKMHDSKKKRNRTEIHQVIQSHFDLLAKFLKDLFWECFEAKYLLRKLFLCTE